jgi:hypothetical protein
MDEIECLIVRRIAVQMEKRQRGDGAHAASLVERASAAIGQPPRVPVFHTGSRRRSGPALRAGPPPWKPDIVGT